MSIYCNNFNKVYQDVSVLTNIAYTMPRAATE